MVGVTVVMATSLKRAHASIVSPALQAYALSLAPPGKPFECTVCIFHKKMHWMKTDFTDTTELPHTSIHPYLTQPRSVEGQVPRKNLARMMDMEDDASTSP